MSSAQIVATGRKEENYIYKITICSFGKKRQHNFDNGKTTFLLYQYFPLRQHIIKFYFESLKQEKAKQLFGDDQAIVKMVHANSVNNYC
jgi:hypothetical protein